MPFPPKKPVDEEEEELETEEEEEDEDESTSDAPPEKMKGNKPNPLRRWAEESEF
jgi:hypothetical protein